MMFPSFSDMTPAYGRSGCRFISTPTGVMKIAEQGSPAAARLLKQSIFLRAVSHTALPYVLDYGAGWCHMEKLDDSLCTLAIKYIKALKSIWAHPAGAATAHLAACDWRQRVCDYAHARLPEFTMHLWPHLVHHVSPIVLTHGDPTLDNMMSRGGPHGNPVFIDPLPPEEHTPPVRALDIGKVLQSLSGWHEAEYGYHPYLNYAHVLINELMENISVEEARQAWAFCVYHLVRATPYARNPERVITVARGIVEEKLKCQDPAQLFLPIQ